MISFKHYLSLLVEANLKRKQFEGLLKNLPKGHGHNAESIQRIADGLPPDMRYVDAAVRYLKPNASDEAISDVVDIARQFHEAHGKNKNNLPKQFSVEDMEKHVAKFGDQTITDPFHQRKIDEAFDVFRKLNREYNGPDSSALSHQQKIDLINSDQNKHFSMELHPEKGVSFKLRTMEAAGCLGPSGLCSSRPAGESYYQKLDGIDDSKHLTAYHYRTPTGADMETQVDPFTGETKKASNQKLNVAEEDHFNELFGKHVENERQEAEKLKNKSVRTMKKNIDEFSKNYKNMDAREFADTMGKLVGTKPHMTTEFHLYATFKKNPDLQKRYIHHLVLNKEIYDNKPNEGIYRPDYLTMQPYLDIHSSIIGDIAHGPHAHLLFNVPDWVRLGKDYSESLGVSFRRIIEETALKNSTNQQAIDAEIEKHENDEIRGQSRLHALKENPNINEQQRRRIQELL